MNKQSHPELDPRLHVAILLKIIVLLKHYFDCVLSVNKDIEQEGQLQLSRELGRKDWMNFLHNRAKEMKPGKYYELNK